MDIYLASGSPRRRTLLENAGFHVHIIQASICEDPIENESPEDLVKRLAQEKVQAAFSKAMHPWLIVGGDTIVELEGEILCKPSSREDAIDMLQKLSGKCHRVLSGYCVGTAEKIVYGICETKVAFRVLSRKEIIQYVDLEKPFDKSGSYAIQSDAIGFVDKVVGSLTSVVGLPLREVIDAIEQLQNG